MSTRLKIELALYRITQGRAPLVKRKLSISSVAEEAGISPSTIHLRYPDLAERIRGIQNKSSRDQRDKKVTELKQLKAENQKLQKLIKQFSKYAKLCPKCLKVKPFKSFHKSGRDGLQCYCKPCHKKVRI